MPKVRQYRKKPTTVWAYQFLDPNVDNPGITYRDHFPHVFTLQGQYVRVKVGEWIISENQEGRFYPCDKQVFEKTYEIALPDGTLPPPGCMPGEF